MNKYVELVASLRAGSHQHACRGSDHERNWSKDWSRRVSKLGRYGSPSRSLMGWILIDLEQRQRGASPG